MVTVPLSLSLLHIFVTAACDCDPDGSLTLQCNQDGSCVCKEGVTGYRCDQCDRGYQGDVPVCESCGECFHNWDRIIAELKSKLKKDYCDVYTCPSLLSP